MDIIHQGLLLKLLVNAAKMASTMFYYLISLNLPQILATG